MVCIYASLERPRSEAESADVEQLTMPTLVQPWTPALEADLRRRYVHGDHTPTGSRVGGATATDLNIGDHGFYGRPDDSQPDDGTSAHDGAQIYADEVLRLGTFEGVEMVATYQHGTMPSVETLIGGGRLFGYATCETYGRCHDANQTRGRAYSQGARCSRNGMEGVCYISSAQTLECGRVTDVHSSHALPTVARAPLYADSGHASGGVSRQTRELVRPCPFGTRIEHGSPTGARIFTPRLLFAGCMLTDDALFEPAAEIHLPQACAQPRPFAPGCMLPGALNYEPGARQVAPCRFETRGCTDSSAINFHPTATQDDGSCIAAVRGCTLPAVSPFAGVWAALEAADAEALALAASGANATAVNGTGSTNATNATDATDAVSLVGADGRRLPAAMQPRAVGTPLQGLVPFPLYGAVLRRDEGANVLEGCVVAIEGCLDPRAANFEPRATINRGTWCVPRITGCLEPTAHNFNPAATVSNASSCIVARRGCTSPTAINYDPTARHPTMCFERIEGCLDASAPNFRCGYGGAELQTPCAMDSSHASLGGALTAAAMVTVHQPLACRMGNTSAASLSDQVSAQIAAALEALMADPLLLQGRILVFELLMEFVAAASLDAVAGETVDLMQAAFARLHPARNARRTVVTVSGGSVVFGVAFEARSPQQLEAIETNLQAHIQNRSTLDAFLEGTGAPAVLTQPRFNVTWRAIAEPTREHSLTVEEAVGITAIVVVTAVPSAIAAFYFLYWRRRQGAGGAKVLPHRSRWQSGMITHVVDA